MIVNVNNNINNNNLNINGINANANSNQNSDANVNNNAANVIMVMPGKRKKKRSLHPRNRKNEIESYPGNDTASNCCHWLLFLRILNIKFHEHPPHLNKS